MFTIVARQPGKFRLVSSRAKHDLFYQVNEENALAKSIIIMQQNSVHFDEGIVRAIQSAFDEWQSRMSTAVQDTWRSSASPWPPLRQTVSAYPLLPVHHLLDPDTPLRNPETIDCPSKEDPSVIPVRVGLLERKKRWTRAYSESFFVLTAAGYLHEYPSSDPQARITPIFSLFLPLCTLGPPSSATTSRSHKFHIEGRKDATGMRTTGLLGRNSQHAYTFRCRSHEEMMEWWNDIRMLVARYLVASEQIERSGPVAAAVRAAGYVSEEDEEGSEEGSSVEEEEEEATAGRYASGGDTDHDEQVPAYSQAHPVKSGLQIGPNGYAVRHLSLC